MGDRSTSLGRFLHSRSSEEPEDSKEDENAHESDENAHEDRDLALSAHRIHYEKRWQTFL